jgi:hypothetical protein
MVVFDMATHGERRIAGTSRGDRPRAASNDFGLIVWSTRNALRLPSQMRSSKL